MIDINVDEMIILKWFLKDACFALDFVSIRIVINCRAFVNKEKYTRVLEKGRNSWVGG
jgi:hypothetical protein